MVIAQGKTGLEAVKLQANEKKQKHKGGDLIFESQNVIPIAEVARTAKSENSTADPKNAKPAKVDLLCEK